MLNFWEISSNGSVIWSKALLSTEVKSKLHYALEEQAAPPEWSPTTFKYLYIVFKNLF